MKSKTNYEFLVPSSVKDNDQELIKLTGTFYMYTRHQMGNNNLKILTLFRPQTPLRVLCKQCRPSSDAADAASDQGQHCLITEIFMQKKKKK